MQDALHYGHSVSRWRHISATLGQVARSPSGPLGRATSVASCQDSVLKLDTRQAPWRTVWLGGVRELSAGGKFIISCAPRWTGLASYLGKENAGRNFFPAR